MEEENTIKERIARIINRMGFNFSHVGTKYLIDTIEILYNANDLVMLRSIEKNVYSMLAEKYSVNASTIKSDIIKATNFMNEQNLMRKRRQEIFYDPYEKTTPKSVINTVLLKL